MINKLDVLKTICFVQVQTKSKNESVSCWATNEVRVSVSTYGSRPRRTYAGRVYLSYVSLVRVKICNLRSFSRSQVSQPTKQRQRFNFDLAYLRKRRFTVGPRRTCAGSVLGHCDSANSVPAVADDSALAGANYLKGCRFTQRSAKLSESDDIVGDLLYTPTAGKMWSLMVYYINRQQ